MTQFSQDTSTYSALLHDMFEQAPSFMAIERGPNHVYELVNDAYLRLIGRRDIVGKTVRVALPEVAEQGYLDVLDRVYASGDRFVASRQSVYLQREASQDLEEVYVDFIFQPIRNSQGTITGIFIEGNDVTENVKANLAIRASEERLRLATEAAEIGFWDVDPINKTLVWPARLKSMFGISPDACVSMADFYGGLHPEDREHTAASFAAACDPDKRALYDVEYRTIGKEDGVVRWVAAKGRGLFDEGGRCVRVIGTAIDISERKRSEEALREASERVKLALDAGAIIGTWNWDLLSDHFTADERFATSFGLDPGQCLKGLRIEEVVATVHPDDKPGLMQAIERALASGDTYAHQYRVRRQDGNYYWIEANGRVERAVDGTSLRFPGVLLDIEKRRSLEQERDRAASFLRAFVEAVPGVVYAKDHEGRIIVANRGTTELIGKAPDEYFGKTDLDFLEDKQQAAIVMANDRRVMESGVAEQVEEEVYLSDGTPVIWLSTKAPFRDLDGEIIGLIGSSVDITSRKQMERELQASEARLRAVLEAAPVGLVFADASGRITGGNAYIEQLVGHPILMSSSPKDYKEWVSFHSDGRQVEAHEYPLARALAGEDRPELEVLYQRGDGRKAWIRFVASAVRNLQGNIIGGVVASIDIDRKRKAERDLRALNESLEQTVATAVAERETALQQLLEAQKMETIGQLTGGVAHDFNNLLATILSNLNLAKKRIDEPRALQLIEGALKGAERGASLTKRLLAFARRQDLKAETVDMVQLFLGMQDLLARSLGPGVRIVADFSNDCPPITVDPHQLELALLNLAVNARDAMPSGGILSFEASPFVLASTHPFLPLPPGAYVQVRVSDTGAGMDAETLRRATEPFFTTKGVGKGTGLGLSMVQGLAVQSGGALRLESEPGRGTTVTLWLPQAACEASVPLVQPTTMTSMHTSSEQSLTILVVDDDALVSMGTTAMLEDLGHQVIEAFSGRAALDELASHPGIDLIVTDHAMPGMTGIELAQKISEIRPDLPIILATGYAELPNGEDPGLPRLSKPFRQEDLAEIIARLIGKNDEGHDASNIVPLR